MTAVLATELNIQGLVDIIGAEPYVANLRQMHEAGFAGEPRMFKDDVARDLGILVVDALDQDEGKLQISLEHVLRGGAPWGHQATYYDAIHGEQSVLYELARGGLRAFYAQRAQLSPTFHERKATRSALLGNNRTFPSPSRSGFRR